ncbi:MAG: N-6 DNA methylase [Leptospiraceae bacterium]|nr:N-6 DNA methylase [Leptospiraceae bacterium]
MGFIFLRHAYSRFLKVKTEVEKDLPTRGGKIRHLAKEDFSGKGALFLREESQFPYLINSTKGKIAERIVTAMDLIEKDHPELLDGVLPKEEYRKLDEDLLDRILKNFNKPTLDQADGDVFGRIYEYFLAQFANLSAHDNGEFLTPQSLVQMIVYVIEPDHGVVFDPANGTAGMFVQSAHFVEQKKKDPNRVLTFKGQEKNPTTIRLAKMNLAVHGLEGSILQGITYYDDRHELLGKADFVMANPPFNVDEIDADKIKNDPRLPFGLPGVNQKKKVSNGNYIWISYFYSYLKEKGRAGFVMSSQASSSGRMAKEDLSDKKKDSKTKEVDAFNSTDEATIRKLLIETGHVDAMMSIRSNFFYTRSVPCELWFFDKGKPKERQDKVLMIDARNVYRKVTRKINDFSPEQLKNLSSIIWLYRGEEDRFLELVNSYQEKAIEEKEALATSKETFEKKYKEIYALVQKFCKDEKIKLEELELCKPVTELNKTFFEDINSISIKLKKLENAKKQTISHLNKLQEELNPISKSCEDLAKDSDLFLKSFLKLTDSLKEKSISDKKETFPSKEINKLTKELEESRSELSSVLHEIRYFIRQSEWLLVRFPEGKLQDVEGLVKLVSRKELKDNDYSLTPGRYVGVAPEEEEDYDFTEKLTEIHIELADLNKEATSLAKQIQKNFEELL